MPLRIDSPLAFPLDDFLPGNFTALIPQVGGGL